MKFKIGDRVRLRSGGPEMTVIALPDRELEDTLEDGYECTWFSGTKNARAYFPEDALEPGPAPTKKKA